MVEEVLQWMGGRCCNKREGVAMVWRGVAMDGWEVLQQTLGDRCNKRERWVGIAMDGWKVLQQMGEVGWERCNRTLQYFTVDGLP